LKGRVPSLIFQILKKKKKVETKNRLSLLSGGIYQLFDQSETKSRLAIITPLEQPENSSPLSSTVMVKTSSESFELGWN
jgi:hypothetical protein